MRLWRSARLVKINGIEVRVDASWAIAAILLTFLLFTAFGFVTHELVLRLFLAVCGVIMLAVSILSHELSHSFVARSKGLKVRSITLFVFGGIALIESEARTPGDEVWIALAGPAWSLILGLVMFGIAAILPNPYIIAAIFLYYSSFTNLLIGIFNLIPAYPLDGGRVLKALLWKRYVSSATAIIVATRITMITAVVMASGSVVAAAFTHDYSLFWIGLVAMFLMYLARREREHAKQMLHSNSPHHIDYITRI